MRRWADLFGLSNALTNITVIPVIVNIVIAFCPKIKNVTSFVAKVVVPNSTTKVYADMAKAQGYVRFAASQIKTQADSFAAKSVQPFIKKAELELAKK